MIEGLSSSEARIPLAAAEMLQPLELVREVCEADALIGESMAMQVLLDQMRRVAPTHACVLIVGESGAGKQRVARCLHELSGRSGHPFITLNCAAIAPHLLEAELFGSEPGATEAGRGAAILSVPRTAPCCWMRSLPCRWTCKSSCCMCSKPAGCATRRASAR